MCPVAISAVAETNLVVIQIDHCCKNWVCFPTLPSVLILRQIFFRIVRSASIIAGPVAEFNLYLTDLY